MLRNKRIRKTTRRASRRLAPLALAVLAISPAAVQAQTVNYSVLPTFEEVRWDAAFGLADARMAGVRLGIDFGPFFSLQPFYAWKDEIGIREGLTLPEGAEVAESFDAKLFGAEFQVNIGSGAVSPFIRGGGGVLRTDDEFSGRRDRIVLRGGGGVAFSLGDRARAELFGDRMMTRLPAPLVPGALEGGEFPEDGLVNSLVLGADIRLPLGGGYRATEGTFGILPGVYLEPYAARIDFHEGLRLARQKTLGARAGVDFNQNVGLRAVYWRGVDDDFKDWQPIEGYGAELQFALNTGPGISPFLLAGGGRVSFKDGFVDLDGEARDRQDHVTLGGGVSIGLGDRTRIELAGRNLLMNRGADLQDATTPNDLVSSWKYSAGVAVAVGARPRTRVAPARDRLRMEQELAAVREENERLRRGEDPAQVPRAARTTVSPVDTLPAPRTLTVPIPEVGEIILRYGPGYVRGTEGALRLDSVRIDQAQIDAMVRDAVRRELDRQGVRPGAPVAPMQPAPSVSSPASSRRLEALMPYSGVQLSPGELLLGARADLGPIGSVIPLDFVPDATFGFLGGSPTLAVGLNARFGWNIGLGHNIFPYAETGLALSSRKFVTFNLGYGAEFDLGSGSSLRRVFVQHRGVNAFSEHQFLVGVRLAR